MKGSFYINGFDKSHKYLWQYKRQIDSSGTYIYHVIRPLFETKCNTRYWECTTRKKMPNCVLLLADGDTLTIDSISRFENVFHITLTWSQTTNGLWSSIKDTPLGRIMGELDKTDTKMSILKNMGTHLDEELDNAVLFCQKLANGIQILQDKIGENGGLDNLKDIFPKGEIVKRTVTYIGCDDT